MTRSTAGQPAPWAVQAARATLQETLGHVPPVDRSAPRITAPAGSALRPGRRQPKRPAAMWGADDALRFLASAQADHDPLLAAYVLVLVNALTQAEVLGLTWGSVDLLAGELRVAWQLQRAGHRLIHQESVPPDGDRAGFFLPLPDICSAALVVRRTRQTAARAAAGESWAESDLVFTTRRGTPVEPRSFASAFGARCTRAGTPRIQVPDARYACASLLVSLGVSAQDATRILRHARIGLAVGGYAPVPVQEIGTVLDGSRFREPGKTPAVDGPWS